MNRERCRFPARRCGVAHRAIRREIECYVVGVGGLTEIGRMASVAGIGRVGVVAVVAGVAVAGNRNVRACERINGIVIKSRGRPGCFGMAGGAIRWEL